MKWSHDYKKDVLHPNKLKPELARASMTTSDVNNQWRSNFQQRIILTQIKFATKNSTILTSASYKMCFGPRFYTPIKLQKMHSILKYSIFQLYTCTSCTKAQKIAFSQ